MKKRQFPQDRRRKRTRQDSEKRKNEVNDGVYIFDRVFLETIHHEVAPSPISGEYYLTILSISRPSTAKKSGPTYSKTALNSMESVHKPM